MIKFFRKIRKKLADDNKPIKYFRYAFGEIILVVIGILIALSINNWNEQRKYYKQETESLVNLKSEFEQNLPRLERSINRCKTVQSSLTDYYELISNPDSTLDQKISKRLPSLFMPTWSPSNGVLLSLQNTGMIFNIKNDSLRLYLVRWSENLANHSGWEERLRNEAMKELDNYTLKFVPIQIARKNKYDDFDSYYPNDIKQKLPEFRKSLIDDPQYYGLIGSVINSSFVYVNVSNPIKEELLKIIRMLDKEISKRNN